MIDPAAAEFVLPVSPTAEVVAQEAFGRVLTGEAAALRDRAMLLLSGLLTREEDPPLTGDEVIAVKVISAPRSVRIEITDAGSGVVLGGLRRSRHPASRGGAHTCSVGSPIDGASSQARRALGSGSSSTFLSEPTDEPARSPSRPSSPLDLSRAHLHQTVE